MEEKLDYSGEREVLSLPEILDKIKSSETSKQEAISLLHHLVGYSKLANMHGKQGDINLITIALVLMDLADEVDENEKDFEVRQKAREIFIRYFLPMLWPSKIDKDVILSIIRFLKKSKKHGKTENNRYKENLYKFLESFAQLFHFPDKHQLDLTEYADEYLQTVIIYKHFALIKRLASAKLFYLIPELYNIVKKGAPLLGVRCDEHLQKEIWEEEGFEGNEMSLVMISDLKNIFLACAGSKTNLQNRSPEPHASTFDYAIDALMILVSKYLGNEYKGP